MLCLGTILKISRIISHKTSDIGVLNLYLLEFDNLGRFNKKRDKEALIEVEKHLNEVIRQLEAGEWHFPKDIHS